jgi:uncharacterized membrane protein YphA (DoxX/SURF4 family)
MNPTHLDTPTATAARSRGATGAHPSAPTTTSPVAARRLADALGWFFAGAGVMRLLPVPFDVALFSSWGLPGWFRAAVGVAELTVGVLTLRDETRPIGALGIGVVMVSAGTVHAALGHSLLIAALVNGSLAAAAFTTAWLLRSEVR